MELPDIEEVQSMLQEDEILIEYYAVGDRIHAFVIGRNDFTVSEDIATMSSIRSSLKGLTFQFSKFHLQPAYVQTHGPMLLAAINHHLKELHRQLIEPLLSLISKKSLVIVPHQVLHYIPFQALYDG